MEDFVIPRVGVEHRVGIRVAHKWFDMEVDVLRVWLVAYCEGCGFVSAPTRFDEGLTVYAADTARWWNQEHQRFRDAS